MLIVLVELICMKTHICSWPSFNMKKDRWYTVVLFDEKMAVQHCPTRDTQDENHASSIPRLKYETPKKRQQQLQSKPSYTSQAKADSLPEASN